MKAKPFQNNPTVGLGLWEWDSRSKLMERRGKGRWVDGQNDGRGGTKLKSKGKSWGFSGRSFFPFFGFPARKSPGQPPDFRTKREDRTMTILAGPFVSWVLYLAP